MENKIPKDSFLLYSQSKIWYSHLFFVLWKDDFVVCRSDICQFERWTGRAVLPRSFSLFQQVNVCLHLLYKSRHNTTLTESILKKHNNLLLRCLMCSNPVDVSAAGIPKWLLIGMTWFSQRRTGRLGLGHWRCWRGRSPALLSPDPIRPFTPSHTPHHAGDPVFHDPQASGIDSLPSPGVYSSENAN